LSFFIQCDQDKRRGIGLVRYTIKIRYQVSNISELSGRDLLKFIFGIVMIQCSKGLSKELTLVLSDTRELNRVPSTE